MDNNGASKFINSIIKNLQLLCHSDVNFNDNIEIIGHLYLNVDSNSKYNYFVNEKVCKNDESSTVFVSNSFHAEPVKKIEVSGKRNETVNIDMKQSKFFEGRFKKNERSNHGVLQKTFSDNSLSPTKQSRSDFPVVNNFQENSELSDKYTRTTQNQISISHNINNSTSFSNKNSVSDCESDQNDTQNQDNYTNLSFDFDKQNSQKCTIDLTMVKCEPGTDEDMEYIRGQQKILEQTVEDRTYTEHENLSAYLSSSDQMSKMYSAAVHHNDIQNTSHLSSISYAGFSENSPHKSSFPPTLPLSVHGSSSCGTSRDGGLNKNPAKFMCPLCPSNLSTKNKLKRHYNEKHLNMRCACQICGSLFTQQSSLKRHILTCHADLINK